MIFCCRTAEGSTSTNPLQSNKCFKMALAGITIVAIVVILATVSTHYAHASHASHSASLLPKRNISLSHAKHLSANHATTSDTITKSTKAGGWSTEGVIFTAIASAIAGVFLFGICRAGFENCGTH